MLLTFLPFQLTSVKNNEMCDVILTFSLRRGKTAMHVIKQTFKIVLNHKYSMFALLCIQAHIFEENKKNIFVSRKYRRSKKISS